MLEESTIEKKGLHKRFSNLFGGVDSEDIRELVADIGRSRLEYQVCE